MTLTPETLRAQARHHRRYGRNVVASQMDNAADAWEAEIHMHALTDECYLDEIEKHGRALNDNERLRTRLEEGRKVAQYAITDMGRMQADLEAMTRRLEAADALAELRAHDFERGWHAALAEDEPKRLLPWDEYVKKVRAAAAGEELEDE